MWHILKFSYTVPDAPALQTKLIGYPRLDTAQRVFDHLELAYQFGAPVRVKGGKTITVSGAWLYESFKDSYADAVAAVNAGNATLMDEARDVDIDLTP